MIDLPTPETDAAQFNIHRFNPSPSAAAGQWYDFARSLERRLVIAERKLKVAVEALVAINKGGAEGGIDAWSREGMASEARTALDQIGKEANE